MYKFRFQDLEIWKEAIEVSDGLFDISDDLLEKKRFGFADQLTRATLSISNNIAEGSGSTSDKDFANFLRISKRSAFEVCNILIILNRRNLISEIAADQFLLKLDKLCRRITSFKNILNR